MRFPFHASAVDRWRPLADARRVNDIDFGRGYLAADEDSARRRFCFLSRALRFIAMLKAIPHFDEFGTQERESYAK